MIRRIVPALLAMALLAAACGTPAATSPAIPAPVAAPQVMPSGAQPISDTPGSSSTEQTCNNGNADGQPFASRAAARARPHAGRARTWPRSSSHGQLVAGVDQNTLLWGYRDQTGQLKGFDIDMVDQVAQAIFGPSWPQHIRYVIVPNADRIPAVSSGQVDIVAETMTITCGRQYRQPGQKVDPTACCVDFSTEYYDAAQRILVPAGSPIRSVADLAGKRVCAASGSTSLVNLTNQAPAAKQVEVVNQTDCLVLLQQGQVDAISTDDTILEGLAAQDPNLKLLSAQLSHEPYGMAISQAHPDFTRFVNAVLANERADGEWKAIWTSELGKVLGPTAPSAPAGLLPGLRRSTVAPLAFVRRCPRRSGPDESGGAGWSPVRPRCRAPAGRVEGGTAARPQRGGVAGRSRPGLGHVGVVPGGVTGDRFDRGPTAVGWARPSGTRELVVGAHGSHGRPPGRVDGAGRALPAGSGRRLVHLGARTADRADVEGHSGRHGNRHLDGRHR